MSLEDSMLKLAASMDRYADVLENISKMNPTQIAIATGGTAPASDTTAKTSRGKKGADAPAPAAEPEAEADPFADDASPADEAPELTPEVIRALVMKVKEKNKDHALALLKKVGAETVSKIDPKQYEKVVELAGKIGVTL